MRPVSSIAVLTLIDALYARHVLLRFQPGLPRLLLTLPLIPPVFILPHQLFPQHRQSPQQLFAFQLCYLHLGLCMSKVLALCLQRGPLYTLATGSAWQFYGAAMLPVAVADDAPVSCTPSPFHPVQLPRRWGRHNCAWAAFSSLVKGIGAWVVAGVLHASLAPPSQDTGVPLWVRWAATNWVIQELLMIMATYLVLGWVCDLGSAIAALLFNITTLSSFNNPAGSRSVAELWRCRWNILVSMTLRWLVYDPIVEGSLVGGLGDGLGVSEPLDITRVGRKQAAALVAQQEELERRRGPRRVLGVLAVFTASGMLHELSHWLALGESSPGGRWLIFFSIQGVCILIQRAMPITASNLVTMIMADSGAEYPGAAEPNRIADLVLTASFMLPCIHSLWLPACRQHLQACFIP